MEDSKMLGHVLLQCLNPLLERTLSMKEENNDLIKKPKSNPSLLLSLLKKPKSNSNLFLLRLKLLTRKPLLDRREVACL